MRDPSNIAQVAALKPDYMGFIFYDKSPRFAGTTLELPDLFPEHVEKVGVFVNKSVTTISEVCRLSGIRVVQLHGHEALEECIALKEAGFIVIKVFSVDDHFNFDVTKPYEPVVDYFLFDTKGKFYGGNAQVFKWDILTHYNQRVPFFLSGGLSPENVGGVRLLKDMNLHAIDVNSGVEQAPGVKDLQKIRLLMEQVKG